MPKLALVAIIAGAFLTFFGCRETKVSTGTSAVPILVDLEELEGGEVVTNSHLVLDDHVALYPLCAFHYTTYNPDGLPSPGDDVDYSYYPVVSKDHPAIQELEDLKARYGGFMNVPMDQLTSEHEFQIIVKTTRFTKVREVPIEIAEEDGTTGLVINRIHKWKSDERAFLHDTYPNTDLDEVMLLDEGRSPTPIVLALLMLAGGIVIMLVGFGLFFIKGEQPIEQPVFGSNPMVGDDVQDSTGEKAPWED